MLSRSCEYAIRSVLYVGRRQKNEGAARPGIREMAEALDIPSHFLGKIMQNLTRHDLLSSAKGPNGGFYLSEGQSANPLIKIVEVVDGLQVFSRCGLGLKNCSAEHPCPLHFDFAPYRDGLESALRNHTVENTVGALRNGEAFLVSL